MYTDGNTDKKQKLLFIGGRWAEKLSTTSYAFVNLINSKI